MKTFFFLLVILSSPVMAQDPAGLAGAGCGPNKVQFDVKLDKKQHPTTQPESGKALVYFISEDIMQALGGKLTFRVGLDGEWAGATRGNSYFYFSAEPGDHHLCTAPQPLSRGLSDLASATSLTFEAGKVYYFQLKVYEKHRMKSELIDNAEGQLLISSQKFGFSNFHQKN